jgi:hypothetical protein
MKKLLIGAGIVALTLAAQAPIQASPAVTIDEFGCGGFVPTASGGFGSFLVTNEKTHSVVTSSGNTMLVCHFEIPAGQEPSRATRAEGFFCGTFLGVTTDSKMVATPGGRATLTCTIKANS